MEAIPSSFYIRDLDGYIAVEPAKRGLRVVEWRQHWVESSGLPVVLQPDARFLQSPRNDDAGLIRRADSGPLRSGGVGLFRIVTGLP